MQTSLTSGKSLLTPILGHPKFTSGLQTTEYTTLRNTGLEYASKFVTAGQWPSISELTATTGNYQLSFWKVAQLHHFLHSVPDPQDFSRQLTTFEEYCAGTELLSQILPKMYSLLNTPPHLPFLDRWERDLNRKFSVTQKQHPQLCSQNIYMYKRYRRRTID